MAGLDDYFLRQGDVVLAMDRPWIPAGLKLLRMRRAEQEPLLVQRVARIRGTATMDTGFLYYALKAAPFTEYILGTQTGTAVPHISATQIKDYQVALPPLPVQCSIARVLGALDDKIELNRKMNETLEQMARAIFKSWFVDFEPSCDKGMVDSPLGCIPKAWRVGVVSDLGAVVCGKTPPTPDKANYGDYMPFVTIPDMHGRVFATETERRLSSKGVDCQANKTVPEMSICVSCIATVGLVVITSEAVQTNQQINSVVPSDRQTIFYCYYALRRLADQIRASGSGGSVVPNLNKGQFAQLKVLLPPSEALRAYDAAVKPAFSRLLTNDRESRTLAAIRDALLPKLMSGEMRVDETTRLRHGVGV